jgi:anti-sigma-K factor RskA
VPHCTPEDLALAALREPLSADDAAHLESCAQCQAEVASLRRGVDLLAVPEFAAPGAPVPPPPRVWDAIVTATGVSTATGLSTAAPEETPDAEVLPFRSRRRPLLMVAAAVVAGGVLGAGAVAVFRGGDDGGQTVQSVALDPLADSDASGEAKVVERSDGSRVLAVELQADALDDGYYEIWMIDTDVVGMVPLGVVSPGSQTVELPADLDISQFPIVDVSVEPLDGDPTHSGVSVARGQMET